MHSIDDERSLQIDECVRGGLGAYDQNMRIGCIFIIMGVSAIGCLIPTLAAGVPKPGSLREAALVYGKFFGTGVVIATAFVHMIPPSFDLLNSPCLGNIWGGYESMTSVFVQATIFAMHLLEYILGICYRCSNPAASTKTEIDYPQTVNAATAASVAHSHTHEHAHEHAHIDLEFNSRDHKSLVSLFLFKFGVAIHSIIIGLSLGVVPEEQYKALLIALCFHQFFEGFALMAAVMERSAKFTLTNATTRREIIGTVAFYALSTPFGILLGVLLHGSYNENSTTSLLVQGILEAVAGGCLIYVGLVHLLTFDFTLVPRFTSADAPRRIQLIALAAMYSGAAAMSVVGNWA